MRWLLLLLFLGGCASGSGNVMDSVALVQGSAGKASGFWFNKHQLFTAAHVVRNLTDATLDDVTGKSQAFEVEYVDPKLDIAIIRTPEPGPSSLGIDCRQPKRGTPVTVLGHPHNGRWIETRGYVAGNGVYRNSRGQLYTMLDVTVLPGMSGGPVVSRGRVVGVMSAVVASAIYGLRPALSGLSLMVSGDKLCAVLDGL